MIQALRDEGLSFEEFFKLLPTRADSENSWTVARSEIEDRNYGLKAVNPMEASQKWCGEAVQSGSRTLDSRLRGNDGPESESDFAKALTAVISIFYGSSVWCRIVSVVKMAPTRLFKRFAFCLNMMYWFSAQVRGDM